jgi:hypothetical protein
MQSPMYIPAPNTAPIPLGTTQMRTEYYGFNPGQPVQQQLPTGYVLPQPFQPPQAPQSIPIQPLPRVQPAQPASGAVGDKYSIFRYVDPSTPQVLPPRSNPNASQQSWQK